MRSFPLKDDRFQGHSFIPLKVIGYTSTWLHLHPLGSTWLHLTPLKSWTRIRSSFPLREERFQQHPSLQMYWFMFRDETKLEILKMEAQHLWYYLAVWCFPSLAIAIAPLVTHTLRAAPVEYLQLKGRFFNGIAHPGGRSMSVKTDWFGAIKQTSSQSSKMRYLSPIWNYQWPTDPLTDWLKGVGARRCYRI